MSSTHQDWKVGDRRESQVHFPKLIDDLRKSFPYNDLTAFVVETFANSIDAGATRIDIFVGNDIIKILDNGKGMTSSEFIDYHNLASLTKTRGVSIGFAGVGAKIYLNKVYHIITETKSKNFSAASNWAFHGDSLLYTRIPVQNRVINENGTYVEIKLKDSNDIKILSVDFIKSTIKTYYNAILLGYYGQKRIIINNEVIQPFEPNPEDIDFKKDFFIKVGKNEVKGYLIKSKNVISDSFQGPKIVVYGKTIVREWFKQYPTYSECFAGMFFADYLIKIVTTSKSDFDRTSKIWKQFNSKVGRAIGEWLDEIGAKAKLPETSDDLSSISHEIEKKVNELLKLPKFTEIANKLFQNLMEKSVSIKSDSGIVKGVEQEGGQIAKGTLGKSDKGDGMPTLGPDDNIGIIENDQGDQPLERIRRRAKGGIKISYADRPDELQEAWIDPSTQTITINQGHPSWKVAEKLNRKTKSENVTMYHMLRSIFKLLADEAGVESPEKTVSDLFQGLYELLPEAR